jgi:hypothetical protein
MRIMGIPLTLSLRLHPGNRKASLELLRQALALNPVFAAPLAYRALLRTVFVAFDLPMPDAVSSRIAQTLFKAGCE